MFSVDPSLLLTFANSANSFTELGLGLVPPKPHSILQWTRVRIGARRGYHNVYSFSFSVQLITNISLAVTEAINVFLLQMRRQ